MLQIVLDNDIVEFCMSTFFVLGLTYFIAYTRTRNAYAGRPILIDNDGMPTCKEAPFVFPEGNYKVTREGVFTTLTCVRSKEKYMCAVSPFAPTVLTTTGEVRHTYRQNHGLNTPHWEVVGV